MRCEAPNNFKHQHNVYLNITTFNTSIKSKNQIKQIYMKKILLLTIVAMGAFMSATAQNWALVDMEYILKNIPAYESATQQIEQSSKKWEKEISALNTEIQKLYKNYQSEMVLLSDEQKKERAQEIVDKETEVKDLKRKYFGNDGELYKKRESLMKPIQEEIYNAIKDIAEAKKYMRVDDRASSPSILFANPAVDISDEVLAKLGYAK